MKYLVISDIHGSYEYFMMALEKYEKYNCDNIVILGDILYHGARNDLPFGYNPKALVKKLNEYKDRITAILGNCDAEVDQMVLDFKLVKESFLKVKNHLILLTHGHHLDEISYNDYIFYGHTHVNKIENKKINIGSLSIPKDGYHTYAILNEEELVFYNLLNDEIIMKVVLE